MIGLTIGYSKILNPKTLKQKIMQDQTFIGRQPIMDLEQQIIGYELFFRHSADAKTAVFEDEFMACVNVLINTIGQMDVKWLLDDKHALLNISSTVC